MTMGEELRAWIPAGGFGEDLYVFDSVESTNTTAASLAHGGAAEGTLVVADHQRRGRGRGGSRWETPAGTAIAMSLVLRPSVAHPLHWTGLGALAVVDALEREGMAARIKWPNDVLLDGRKVAGVLAEACWEANRLRYLVLGIGVNVGRGSVPVDGLAFPATSAEEYSGRVVVRTRLIAGIVHGLTEWNAQLGSARFLQAWEDRLAYKGERVRVELGQGLRQGRLVGLGPEGQARLLLDDGREVSFGGEARSLRPTRDEL
jgi:BirA family biotin operon repressor/biotin-[acetyl-CoA-carboxylase] ligase